MKRSTIIGVLIAAIIFVSGLIGCQDVSRKDILQRQLVILSENDKLSTLIKNVMPVTVFVEYPGYWTGSGVVVGDNKVLTARHIIRDANELEVTTWDNKTYDVEAWYVDSNSDCGIIVIDGKFEDIAELTDSNEVETGDIVFCIGSPYGKELFNTVSLGIISGIDRSIPYFSTESIFTGDISINPGNSGGPVFNMNGKVIGIVVGSRHGAEGLAAIVPSNTCKVLF